MEIREELKSEFIDNLQQLQIEGNYNELVHLIDSNRNIKEDTYEYYKSKLIEFRVKRVLSMQNLYREIGEVIEKIDRNKFPGLWGSLVWEQLRQSLRPSVDIKAIKELIDFYKSLSKLDVNSKSIFLLSKAFLVLYENDEPVNYSKYLEIHKERAKLLKSGCNIREYAYAIIETLPPLCNLKRYEIVEQSLKEIKEIFEQTGNLWDKITYNNQRADLFIDGGDYKKALDKYFESYEICMKLDAEVHLPNILTNLGLTFIKLGNYEQAKTNFHQALEIYKINENEVRTIIGLMNLANLYQTQGNPTTSLKYLLEATELLNQREDMIYPDFYYALGQTYLSLNHLDKAKMNFEQALTGFKRWKDYYSTAATMFELLNIAYIVNSFEELDKYSNKIAIIAVDNPNNQFVTSLSKLSKAILLKSKNRLAPKIKAMELLRKLLNEEALKLEYKHQSVIHLCELLIMELKITQNNELITEINDHLGRLSNFAEKENSKRILVNILVLKSKIMGLQDNYHESLKILDRAEKITIEAGMDLLKNLVEGQKKMLEDHIRSWDTIIAEHNDIIQKVKSSEVEEYIKKALRLGFLNQ